MDIFLKWFSATMEKPFLQLENHLRQLKKRWPKPFSKEVSHLFQETTLSLRDIKKWVNGSQKLGGKKKKSYFNLVSLLNQVLKAHDFLFLGRQLGYHVVATTDLPETYGLEEEALTVLNELLSAASKQAAFGSTLEIHVQGIKLREGPALQVRLVYNAGLLDEAKRQKILEQIFGSFSQEGKKGVAFAKHLLRRVGGGLWMEFPSDSQVAFVFQWPAFDSELTKLAAALGTYKYEIWITDYNKIRQRFGIERSQKLVSQIEKFLRSLVRHPVDMIVALPSRGMITAIYESQEGVASSVATRISQRLKGETFRLGKKNVIPKYKYQLSYLA